MDNKILKTFKIKTGWSPKAPNAIFRNKELYNINSLEDRQRKKSLLQIFNILSNNSIDAITTKIRLLDIQKKLMLTESPLKLITYIPTNISKSWIAGAINIAYKTNIKFTGNWINKCIIKGGNIPIRNILPKEILEKSLNSLNNNKIWFLEQCVLNKNILADWEAIALNKIAKKPIWYKYISENWINIKTSLKNSKLDLNNFYNYAWQPNWNKLHKWYYI